MNVPFYGPDTTSTVDFVAIDRTVRAVVINPVLLSEGAVAEGSMSVLDAKALRAQLDEAIWQAENYEQPVAEDNYLEARAS